MNSLPTRLAIFFVASGTTMSSDDQKRFEKYINLGLPKFSGAIGNDDYEFLIY